MCVCVSVLAVVYVKAFSVHKFCVFHGHRELHSSALGSKECHCAIGQQLGANFDVEPSSLSHTHRQNRHVYQWTSRLESHNAEPMPREAGTRFMYVCTSTDQQSVCYRHVSMPPKLLLHYYVTHMRLMGIGHRQYVQKSDTYIV